MSGREKPDAPGLWRDANEKTVVACMESGELAIRDADTGEILSAGQLEQAAPFQRTEWKGIDLTRAGFSAMPDTAGCWSDANGDACSTGICSAYAAPGTCCSAYGLSCSRLSD